MRPGSADPSALPFIPRLLQRTTSLCSRHPWGTLGLALLATILSLGVSARFLTFKTSRSDLIDPQAEFQQRWLRYTERFGDAADAVIVVEGRSADDIRAAIDELGSALEAQPDLFDRVFYRIDLEHLRPKALQYLSPQELEQGLSRLEAYAPILDGHWERAGLESYCRRLAGRVRAGAAGRTGPDFGDDLQRARDLCRSLDAFITDPQQFANPWPPVLTPATSDPGLSQPRYLLNDDGTMGFVLAAPRDASRDFSGTSTSIDRLRDLIRAAASRHPRITIGLTGIPVLEADEMRRSQSDMSAATVISLLGVSALMLVFFRGVKHPLLAVAVLAVGIAWALGFTTLAVGHLNILSLSFATILIGLGIDYAICYLSRYLHLRQEGVELRPALVRSSSEVGTGILTVAVTTALGFLCARFTNFRGVAELGVISAGGILLCALATFTVLPALTVLADRHVAPQRLPSPYQGHWLRSLIARRPWALAGSTIAVMLAGGACAFEYRDGRLASRVQYDANLLNLQARDLESVAVLDRVFEHSESSVLYAVSVADSPAGARRLREAYERLPTVGRVDELASFLPRYSSSETGLLVQGFHSRLSRVAALPRDLPLLDPAAAGAALEELYAALREAAPVELAPESALLDALLNRLEQLPLATQVQLLSGYQHAMLKALHAQFLALAAIADPAPVGVSDIPGALRRRFVSEHGDWLVKVYPQTQVWDEAPLEAFVTDLRSVDPDVTGTPLQNYEAARQIRQSYIEAAVYALAVTCLVLLIDTLEPGPRWAALIAPLGVIGFALFGIHGAETSLNPVWLAALYVGVALAVGAVLDFSNFRNTCLAMLPPLAGGFLMFGILGIIDVDLNPANLIVLPLLLGMGIDCGVHVLHDYRRQTGPYRTSASTLNTVVLTSTTTIVGFAAMLGASHQGLVSIGLVLVIGVTCCLFVSLVTLPAILTLLSRSAGPFPSPAAEVRESLTVDEAQQILPLPAERWRRSA